MIIKKKKKIGMILYRVDDCGLISPYKWKKDFLL